MKIHIYDATDFYNVASRSTGAADGDDFVLTAANIDLSVKGISQNLFIMQANQETLIESGGGQNSLIYAEGINDAIVQVNVGPQYIVDLGRATTLDMQSNPNGIVYLYNQQTDPFFKVVLSPTDQDRFFIADVQMTSADLTPPDPKGNRTLTLFNGGTITDTMQIAGFDSGKLTLLNVPGSGVYMTQGPFLPVPPGITVG